MINDHSSASRVDSFYCSHSTKQSSPDIKVDMYGMAYIEETMIFCPITCIPAAHLISKQSTGVHQVS